EGGLRSRRRARGAREALIELYGEHYAPLVRLAHLVAHDPSIAEDLVHEAFIKLYGSWHRVRDHDRAPAYLRTTLVNLARGRECLVLRHYSDMTETEIAATLGISVGSVRTHIKR